MGDLRKAAQAVADELDGIRKHRDAGGPVMLVHVDTHGDLRHALAHGPEARLRSWLREHPTREMRLRWSVPSQEWTVWLHDRAYADRNYRGDAAAVDDALTMALDREAKGERDDA